MIVGSIAVLGTSSDDFPCATGIKVSRAWLVWVEPRAGMMSVCVRPAGFSHAVAAVAGSAVNPGREGQALARR
ncbi:hypothetical protein K0651_03050 [Ornithinimicrobium sp. Arc0846-15]|nr:hypothetical protein [Ornithinimicrobium laminariae]